MVSVSLDVICSNNDSSPVGRQDIFCADLLSKMQLKTSPEKWLSFYSGLSVLVYFMNESEECYNNIDTVFCWYQSISVRSGVWYGVA